MLLLNLRYDHFSHRYGASKNFKKFGFLICSLNICDKVSQWKCSIMSNLPNPGKIQSHPNPGKPFACAIPVLHRVASAVESDHSDINTGRSTRRIRFHRPISSISRGISVGGIFCLRDHVPSVMNNYYNGFYGDRSGRSENWKAIGLMETGHFYRMQTFYLQF